MRKGSAPPQNGTPPTSFPQGVPDQGHTHQFIFESVFELTQSFARVEQKIDALKERVEKLDGSVNTMEHTVSKVKGAMLVGGIVFTIAIAVVGWMVAGDVKITMGGDKSTAAAPTTADAQK